MIDIDLNDVEKIIIKKKQEGISFKEAAEKVNAEKVDSEYIPLKPCPFCGSKEIYIDNPDTHCFYVLCANCGVNGTTANTKERAKEAWNRRADDGLRKQYAQ